MPTPPRICFERILPDAFDTDRLVRRALRKTLIGDSLDPEAIAHHTRMALPLTKKWPPGSTLNCRFLDGSAKLRKAVKTAARQWQQYANIKFRFIATGKAQIRISFSADDGSWSAVGRDALNEDYFPPHEPTMNFGWLTDHSSKEEIQSVVLHEFGHAIGCIHEHQSPTFTRKWNKKEVFKNFSGPPNHWDEADITHNVLAKYSPKGVAATHYDPASIMLYLFPAELFTDGGGPTNENIVLSPTDQKMIAKMYP